jgi:hypothetical protein
MTDFINTVIENFDYDEEAIIIPLPCSTKTTIYHLGSKSNYQRFCYSYFIKEDTESDRETLLYKYIIISVQYVPDELYSSVDGKSGKCWIVTINDNDKQKIFKYYIRDWIDIVEFYNEKGLVFVEEK